MNPDAPQQSVVPAPDATPPVPPPSPTPIFTPQQPLVSTSIPAPSPSPKFTKRKLLLIASLTSVLCLITGGALVLAHKSGKSSGANERPVLAPQSPSSQETTGGAAENAGGATDTGAAPDTKPDSTPSPNTAPATGQTAQSNNTSSNSTPPTTTPDPDPTPAPTPQPKTVTVDVNNFTFTPQNLTINKGDTVKWINSAGSHTVTSNNGLFDAHLSGSQSYSYTFSSAGTFNYVCTPHQSMGMVGTITVVN